MNCVWISAEGAESCGEVVLLVRDNLIQYFFVDVFYPKRMTVNCVHVIKEQVCVTVGRFDIGSQKLRPFGRAVKRSNHYHLLAPLHEYDMNPECDLMAVPDPLLLVSLELRVSVQDLHDPLLLLVCEMAQVYHDAPLSLSSTSSQAGRCHESKLQR